MRVLTSEEGLETELTAANRLGISTLVSIQAAGYAVAQFCLANFKFRSVIVICGKGKAGAEGLSAAKSLGETVAAVSAIILAKNGDEVEADTTKMCSNLGLETIWISDEAEFEAAHVQEAFQADLVIDAIAGSESKPPLSPLEKRAVQAINDAFGTVVSVDVPSGIDADIMTPAPQTHEDVVFSHGIITFVAPKPAHVFGELTSGPIAVNEIGMQPALSSHKVALQVITGQEVGIAFPPRLKDAHKGQFGHVLVIAGSAGKAGAAGLAGLAALRAGAGLVTVACPRSIQATVAAMAPELMTEGLQETVEGSVAVSASDRVEQLLSAMDVVIIGPGLSNNQETAAFVRNMVARCPLPFVLDADGLNSVSGDYEELKPPEAAESFRVLTLHPGEAARLLGVSAKDIQADRIAVAQRIARKTKSCVVLKGWRTVVAGLSGETWINMSGNPALAKGGSGDVLSGLIGVALARRAADPGISHGMTAPARIDEEHRNNAGKAATFLHDVSVAAAVHLHGLAGDFARDMFHENTVLATDLVLNLSEAFRDCELQMDRGLYYLQK